MQILVLVEALALKCSCNHSCVCTSTLSRLILSFLFINCEAFCGPEHCWSVCISVLLYYKYLEQADSAMAGMTSRVPVYILLYLKVVSWASLWKRS